MPAEATIYVGDQAHIPYGPRPAPELFRFSEGLTRFLLAEGCKAVVVACNSASAAALKHLREEFPDTPFIGMEPAVKPAAERTRSRVVVVLATPATLQGELFTATAERYAHGVRVIGEPCPGLVAQIEGGRARHADTEEMLRGFLAPGLAAGADQVVLACTHYPFVIDTIRRIAGPTVDVIDPAPAVVRRLRDVLRERGIAADAAGAAAPPRFFTTEADVPGFARALHELVRAPETAQGLRWTDGGRVVARP
jgi:glutamate racemase